MKKKTLLYPTCAISAFFFPRDTTVEYILYKSSLFPLHLGTNARVRARAREIYFRDVDRIGMALWKGKQIAYVGRRWVPRPGQVAASSPRAFSESLLRPAASFPFASRGYVDGERRVSCTRTRIYISRSVRGRTGTHPRRVFSAYFLAWIKPPRRKNRGLTISSSRRVPYIYFTTFYVRIFGPTYSRAGFVVWHSRFFFY